MKYKKTESDENFEKELRECYRSCFRNKAGERVIKDLERFARANLIDRNDPNPNSAIYRIAQLNIIERIKQKLGESND